MKLGFLTAKIEDIEKAKNLGFQGVELNSGAFGNASHGGLDNSKVIETKRLCSQHGIEITALAFYNAAFDPRAPNRITQAYERVFDAAESLGVRTIASMSGFDGNCDWKGNLQLFADRFGPVAALAERRGLRVAFENWMGIGGRLPFRPINMGGSPDTWDDMFKTVPSKALGIEFDPSHLYWQGIDPIRALKEYRNRVYHVHAKDTRMLPERRYRGGVNGDYFNFCIPGYGEINWPQFISALDEIGYTGGVAIEHEDPVYSGERFDEGLIRGWQVLHPLIHPGASPGKCP